MKTLTLTTAFFLGWGAVAFAQVPVIDDANLTQAREIASATNQILSTDRDIMSYTQKTLQAVTGVNGRVKVSQMAAQNVATLGLARSPG